MRRRPQIQGPRSLDILADITLIQAGMPPMPCYVKKSHLMRRGAGLRLEAPIERFARLARSLLANGALQSHHLRSPRTRCARMGWRARTTHGEGLRASGPSSVSLYWSRPAILSRRLLGPRIIGRYATCALSRPSSKYSDGPAHSLARLGTPHNAGLCARPSGSLRRSRAALGDKCDVNK